MGDLVCKRSAGWDWGTVALAVSFAALLFAFTRWWWGFGLRRYSGASA